MLNHTKTIVNLFIILIVSSFLGCSKLVPKPDIPAYLQIDSFSYTVSSIDTTISQSVAIENVWVYANNLLLGVYILPAKVPVLLDGNVEIQLRPGIKQNGISNTRVYYPFYKSHIENINLVRGSTHIIKPTTSYFDYTKIKYRENFETSIFKLEKTSISNVEIKRTNDPNEVFEGNYSGKIYLTANDTLAELTSTTEYALPTAGVAVYLELNYKNNTAFEFGIIANQSGGNVTQTVYSFNPSYDLSGSLVWKKIYIDMSTNVSSLSAATSYKIYFYAQRSKSDNDAIIYLDNIKVVH